MSTKVKSASKKAAKKPIKKAAKKVSAIKKAPAKKAPKSPAKKTVKPALKKKAKAPSITKPKKAIKSKVKSIAGKVGKRPPVANSPAVKARSKTVAPSKKEATSKMQENPLPSKRSRGQDMHFIPAHNQESPLTIHDSNREEKLFHHTEEIALHNESEKVKTAMTTRMGKKRTFQNRSGA
jgi:hypothetical protein